MKKSVKSFLAATVAGAMALTSTAGVFATTYPTYKEDATHKVIVNWCHGEYNEYDYAGYNFESSGLVADGGGNVRAANFVKLSVIEKGEPTTPSAGAKTKAQIAYCIAPNQHIVNYEGYDAKVLGNLDKAVGIPLNGGTKDKSALIDLVMTYGYTGTMVLNGEANARHGGAMEWAEYSMPEYAYETASNTKKTATENRLGTQICIWSIVCGWYEDDETWNKARDTFTKMLPDDYRSGVRSVANSIRTKTLAMYSATKPFYAFEKKMNDEETRTIKKMQTSTSYIFKIYDVPNSILTQCNGSFGSNISKSLYKQGLEKGDFKVTKEGDNTFMLEILKSAMKDDLKVEVYADPLGGTGFLRAVVLYSGANQDVVLPTPAAFSFNLDGESVPVKARLQKTFNGKSPSAVNAEIGAYKFMVIEGKGSPFTEKYLIFDKTGPGQYNYTGRSTGNENDATPLKLDDLGYIEINGLPSDKDYWLAEISAQEGWNGQMGRDNAIPLELNAEGFGVVFDNHGSGTGILVMDKKFQTLSGEVVDKNSTGDDKTRYDNAIAGLKFTLFNANDIVVNVTGSNGVYKYAEGTGGAEGQLSLDSNARLVVTDLPAGNYYIRETEDSARRALILLESDLIQKESFHQVASLPDDAKVEDVLGTPAHAEFLNVFDLTEITVEIEKTSEDDKVEGFQFKVTGSNGFTKTGATDNKGKAKIEGLPAYDDDGKFIEYTVEELDTMADGSSALKYKLCAPEKFSSEEAITGNGIKKLTFKNFLNTADLGIIKTSDDDNVYGIKFTVTGSDGSSYTAQTDRSGYVEIEGLRIFDDDGNLITYQVKEQVPVRYKNQLPQTVIFDPAKSRAQVTFNNESKRADYIIHKWADDGLFEGLSFTITGSDGSTKTEAVNAAGQVVFRNLLIYDKNNSKIVYSVFENNTPSRYYTPKAITNITLEDPDAPGGFLANYGEVENTTKKGTLTINKVDEANNPLTGAIFRLYSGTDYDENGDAAVPKAFASTDSNGVAKFKDIAVGREYVVIESTAPYGYARTTTPYRFTITEDYPEYKMTYNWVNKKSKDLKIIKKDAVSDAPLLGAFFELRDADGNVITKKVTGEDGTVTFYNLDFGVYTVVETDAPFGYALPEDEADRTYTATIEETAPEEVIELEITNTPDLPTNSIAVYKIDGDTKEPLAGAVFELTPENGEPRRAQSNAKGLALFEDVTEGKYTIKEITAPAGYLRIDETIDVDFTEGNVFSYILENFAEQVASLTVVKVDGTTEEPLAGANFIAFRENGEVAEGPYATNADGKVTFMKLQLGNTYKIREVKAPEDGYIASVEDFEIKIDETDVEFKVTATANNSYISKFGYKDADGNDKPLSRLDAEQIVTKPDGAVFNIVAEWTNDKEIEQKYTDVKIVKTAEDNLIEGLTFVLSGNGEEYIGVTDADGKIEFKHIPVYDDTGERIEYIVYEINTPDRYYACPYQTAELTEFNEHTFFFTNKLVDEAGTFVIKKTSEDNKVSGIKFIVTASTGDKYIAVTNGSGEAVFKNLPVYDNDDNPISYVVSEKTPKGYKVLSDITVDRIYDKAVVELDYHNVPETKPAVIVIRKTTTDRDADEVIGAKFGLFTDPACNQLLATADVIGNDATEGYVTFTDGIASDTTYYVKETVAPNGYKLSNKVYECKVDANGSTTYREYGAEATYSPLSPLCINYREDEEPTTAKVIKTDGTNALTGAVFGLYSNASCTTLLAQRTSSIDENEGSDTYNKAVVAFEVEPGNVYYIKEIAAPAKYEASDTIYKVIVDMDGSVQYGILGETDMTANFPVCVNTPKSEQTTTTTKTTLPPPIVITTTTTPPSGDWTTVPPGGGTTTTKVTTVTNAKSDTSTTTTSKYPLTEWDVVSSIEEDDFDDIYDPEEDPEDDYDDDSTFWDNSPTTGTMFKYGALIVFAIASGVICVMFILKGIKAKKNKE